MFFFTQIAPEPTLPFVLNRNFGKKIKFIPCRFGEKGFDFCILILYFGDCLEIASSFVPLSSQ